MSTSICMLFAGHAGHVLSPNSSQNAIFAHVHVISPAVRCHTSIAESAPLSDLSLPKPDPGRAVLLLSCAAQIQTEERIDGVQDGNPFFLSFSRPIVGFPHAARPAPPRGSKTSCKLGGVRVKVSFSPSRKAFSVWSGARLTVYRCMI